MIIIKDNSLEIYTLKVKRNYINTNHSSQSDKELAGMLITFNTPPPLFSSTRESTCKEYMNS